VQDTGVGLAANSVAQMFSAFLGTKRGGMGMGRSISGSLVEAHGGWLEAGVRTGFQFIVPVVLANADA